MNELEILLGFGLIGATFALAMLVYIRQQKQKLRKSILRYERIKEKLED
jgi:hypothetical protein